MLYDLYGYVGNNNINITLSLRVLSLSTPRENTYIYHIYLCVIVSHVRGKNIPSDKNIKKSHAYQNNYVL